MSPQGAGVLRQDRSRWRQIAICTLLTGWLISTVAPAQSIIEDEVDRFLSRHWRQPIMHQGDPPSAYSVLERSLDPSACGSCHPRQLADWRASRHAHATGAGLHGQVLRFPIDDPEAVQACLRCHAPLAEQTDGLIEILSTEAGASAVAVTGNRTDTALYRQGVVCAACHLRQWRVFGPPGREPRIDPSTLSHDGFVEQRAFEDSRFCAVCHQFDEGGYALNGKPLENTYAEWLASPQAAAGQSCQSCHMPDRRHLWRGIQDREMVRSGVGIELRLSTLGPHRVAGQLVVTNTNTGHRFPTYVTPRVVLEAVQLDKQGEPITTTRRERLIARKVSLDLSEEISDTRLAPGESLTLDYVAKRDPGAAALRVRVRVEPDRFYRDFYRALRDSDAQSMESNALQQALGAAETSAYTLFERVVALNDIR